MSGDNTAWSMSRRSVLLFGGIGVVTSIVGCSGGEAGQGASTSATRAGGAAGSASAANKGSSVEAESQVDLDFESGSLGPPVTYSVGATVGSAFSDNGRYGCRLEPSTSNGGLASLVVNNTGFSKDKPWAVVSIRFRLVTLPKPSDGYMNLFEVGNTASEFPKSQFTVYFKHDALVCDFSLNENMQIASMPVVGTWHTIDAIVGYGATAYRARVRFDGGETKELISKNDKSAQDVKALWIHYPTVPVDYTMDLDDVRMMTESTEPGFLPVS